MTNNKERRCPNPKSHIFSISKFLFPVLSLEYIQQLYTLVFYILYSISYISIYRCDTIRVVQQSMYYIGQFMTIPPGPAVGILIR
jgi:hypothetical protein